MNTDARIVARPFTSHYDGKTYWCDALQLSDPPRESYIELRACSVLPGHTTELEALTCASRAIEGVLARYTQEARDDLERRANAPSAAAKGWNGGGLR